MAITKEEMEQWRIILRTLKEHNDETLARLRQEEEEREEAENDDE